jgi:hypothetical protein
VDLGLDPVHGERDQADAARRVEALDGLHQADIAFLDQVGMRQAVAEVAAGDGDHQAKVRENKLTRRLHIAFAVETLGQPGFLGFGQHRITVRGLDIGIDVANRRGDGKRQGMGHSVISSFNSHFILALAA